MLPGVRLAEGDPNDSATLVRALRGHDALINLVGILNEDETIQYFLFELHQKFKSRYQGAPFHGAFITVVDAVGDERFRRNGAGAVGQNDHVEHMILGDRVADVQFAPDGRMFFTDPQDGGIYWVAPRTLTMPPR